MCTPCPLLLERDPKKDASVGLAQICDSDGLWFFSRSLEGSEMYVFICISPYSFSQSLHAIAPRGVVPFLPLLCFARTPRNRNVASAGPSPNKFLRRQGSFLLD